MILCNETITVFNKRWDGERARDLYIPTVIKGVSWHCEIASVVDNTGLHASNRFTIRIPTNADFSGKTYVDRLVFKTSDDTVFTLASGDIIIKGEVTEMPVKPAALKESFSDYCTVLGVTDNRRAKHAPHWRVVGS